MELSLQRVLSTVGRLQGRVARHRGIAEEGRGAAEQGRPKTASSKQRQQVLLSLMSHSGYLALERVALTPRLGTLVSPSNH